MPRIRCHYIECVFVDNGYCSAAAVELDPETGCATFAPNEDAASKDENLEEEEQEELEGEEIDEEEDDEEEDDTWEEDKDGI